MDREALKNTLTKVAYDVTQSKQTEEPFSPNYEDFKKQEGFSYYCTCCQNLLFDPTLKFDSGCGWPAFSDALPGAISIVEDET